MPNPPKQKVTAGEREVLLILEKLFPYRKFRRTSPGCAWDIESIGSEGGVIINILASRPDRGDWLFSMAPESFGEEPQYAPNEIRVEVKRRGRFAHHTIYDETFGGSR